MECVSYTVPSEVPPQFSKATTSSTSFYWILSGLEQLEEEETVRKHTLITTSRGHLVELQEGKMLRSTPSPKDVTKIVVHHNFQPLQRYIVLLCASKKAMLLAYQDFKLLKEWEDVEDVTSADPEALGFPQLVLTQLTGKSATVSNTKLMSFARSDESSEEKEEARGGMRDVIHALETSLKGGLRYAEQLRCERKLKETFIAEELSAFEARLQGHPDPRIEKLVPVIPIEGKRDVEETSTTPPSVLPGHLKVLQVHQKLVHDKWVIGVSVINDGERMLVTLIDLVLHCGQGSLYHTTRVLKTVRHSLPNTQAGTTQEFRVTIGDLDPPMLKPKKRATVIGVCDIPSFKDGPGVTCSGVLSYTCKPLSVKASQSFDSVNFPEYQISFPLVELRATEMHSHMVALDPNDLSQIAGVSFSIVALVAASICNRVSLSTLVSPLDTFLQQISKHLRLVKVYGVSDFYVLYPKESHPLQHSGFIFHPVDTHNLELTLYTKDETQVLVLIHSLQAALPQDTSIQASSNSEHNQTHSQFNLLLARMKETAATVVDGLQKQICSKTPRIEKENKDKDSWEEERKYKTEREKLLARKGDITFKGEEYSIFRKKLMDMQLDMDNLYLKHLKQNCASD